MNIIGILGFKGSGKDTAAAVLLDHGFRKYAFADSLKDVVASMFGWSRAMMEGDTAESREWREKVDPWWASRLNRSNFTPRLAMSCIGTDVIRQHFNDSMWIYNMEKRIINDNRDRVVLTDCRYPNEADMIRRMGGKLIRIVRGAEPEYWKYSSVRPSAPDYKQARHIMETTYGHIHSSEWAWNNITVDYQITNDHTVEYLHSKVLEVVGL